MGPASRRGVQTLGLFTGSMPSVLARCFCLSINGRPSDCQTLGRGSESGESSLHWDIGDHTQELVVHVRRLGRLVTPVATAGAIIATGSPTNSTPVGGQRLLGRRSSPGDGRSPRSSPVNPATTPGLSRSAGTSTPAICVKGLRGSVLPRNPHAIGRGAAGGQQPPILGLCRPGSQDAHVAHA